MDNSNRMLSTNLKHLRESRNYSQVFLSEISEVSRATIGKIEAGNCDPVTLGTLKKLADALDVSVGDFFTPFRSLGWNSNVANVQHLRGSRKKSRGKKVLGQSVFNKGRKQG